MGGISSDVTCCVVMDGDVGTYEGGIYYYYARGPFTLMFHGLRLISRLEF